MNLRGRGVSKNQKKEQSKKFNGCWENIFDDNIEKMKKRKSKKLNQMKKKELIEKSFEEEKMNEFELLIQRQIRAKKKKEREVSKLKSKMKEKIQNFEKKRKKCKEKKERSVLLKRNFTWSNLKKGDQKLLQIKRGQGGLKRCKSDMRLGLAKKVRNTIKISRSRKRGTPLSHQKENCNYPTEPEKNKKSLKKEQEYFHNRKKYFDKRQKSKSFYQGKLTRNLNLDKSSKRQNPSKPRRKKMSIEDKLKKSKFLKLKLDEMSRMRLLLLRKEIEKKEKIAIAKKKLNIETRRNYLRITNRAKSAIHLDKYSLILQTEV